MITLRRIKSEDKFLFYEYLKDEKIKNSYKNLPRYLSLRDVENQIEKIKSNCYVICLDGVFIGLRYFWPRRDYVETGSWLASGYRGKGYGSVAFGIF